MFDFSAFSSRFVFENFLKTLSFIESFFFEIVLQLFARKWSFSKKKSRKKLRQEIEWAFCPFSTINADNRKLSAKLLTFF